MRVRRIWPVAFLLLTPVLAACGDDTDEASDSAPTDTPSTSESTSAAPTTSAPVEETSSATPPPAPAGLPGACDVVTSDDIAKAFGVSFEPGDLGGGSTSEQGVDWKSDNCDFDAEDLVEVTVKLTAPEDFTVGTFGCPQPTEIAAIVEPVDDIAGATEGWWKVSDSPPLEATLRACADDVLVEVDVEYEDGVDYKGDPRNQSIAIAELVLSNLQG